VLAHLRAADTAWVGRGVLIEAARVSDDAAQPARALASLVSDGLVSEHDCEYALGGDILQR